MSEESGVTETGAAGGSEFQPITSQEDLNKIIGDRVKRAKPADYDELKAKADQFTAWEQSQKSEQEKLQESLSSLTADNGAKDRKIARLEVIASEGIPAEYQDLVHGDTPEALAASAKKVKDILSKASAGNGKPGVTYQVNLDGDGSESLALNGSGLEDALKNKLGIA